MATTEIGFYHLQKWPLERALPRLLTQIYERGLKAVVLVGSEDRMEALNALLWTFSTDSFLPHGSARDGNAPRQPIYLTTEEDNPNGATVLVLTDGMDAGSIGGFERCFDMFDGNDPEAVAAARARWKQRKEAGYTLTYWQQTDAGKWEKKG